MRARLESWAATGESMEGFILRYAPLQGVKLHSQHVPTLRASMNLYMATTTMEQNPLPPWTRELIATVVSRTNDCFY